MKERFNIKINPEDRSDGELNKRAEKKPEGGGIDRRTFLKGAVATAILAGVAKKWLFNGGAEDAEDEEKKDSEKSKNAIETPTQRQQDIEVQDKDIIGKTIEEQLKVQDRIVLDRTTKKALQERWRKSYSAEGENHLGLTQALDRMSPWLDEMKAVFAKAGVPEEYVYLTIPESHFDVKAVSRKYAGGPYQFTKDTAGRFDLYVSDSFDQRFDPIESAEACAKHLKYSYEIFNNDWDLALADYNGGYTNQYAKFRTEKSDRNYDDYLAWREERLNKFISENYFEHEIASGDSLGKIAEKYSLSVAQLQEFNGLEDVVITAGKTLKIPLTKTAMIGQLDDSLENLNYPEKFYAVLEVIKDEELLAKVDAQKLLFNVINVPKTKTVEFRHVVKKGEGLLAIARSVRARAKKMNHEFDASVAEVLSTLQQQNGISDPRKIRAGQNLSAHLKVERPMTLQNIAKRYKLQVSVLKKINPAVIDETAVLPDIAKIRIPK